MAQWFNANNKYSKLAQELIDAAASDLGHIDLSKVLFLEIQESKPKQAMVIKQIKEPFDMLLGKSFYIAINEELISTYSDEQLELEVFRTLLHIDVEDGKMRYPDVYDFSCIINIFGIDWREKNISSILSMVKSGKTIL